MLAIRHCEKFRHDEVKNQPDIVEPRVEGIGFTSKGWYGESGHP